MPNPRVQVGEVEIVEFLDAEADLTDSSITDAFPGAPPDELLSFSSRYPEVYAEGGGWHFFGRAWLIRAPEGVVLMDTGVGSTVALSWIAEPGRLLGGLAEEGLGPEDIRTVVLSHVHDDHVGGTVTAAGEIVFPNARHLLQRTDHDALIAWGQDSAEDAKIWDVLLRPLEEAGSLDLLDGDHELSTSLRLRHAPGHTPGHQVLEVSSAGARALLSADTWNHPAQVTHPDWYSATDADPAIANATRRMLGAELAGEPGTVVAPAHFGAAFGHVTVDADGTASWTPAS